MLDYNQFIKQTSHFQPRFIVEFAGVDVSHLLIEDHSVKTDTLLDTPIFNIYTTGRAEFCLNNSDDQFNTKNSSNFFTELTPTRDSDGWETPVKISFIFDNFDAPTTPRVLFVGYIEKIEEMRSPRWVRVLVLGKSGLLQRALVDDFGVSVQRNVGGPNDTKNYTSENPVFELPRNSAPISRGSVTAEIGNSPLEVLPEIPLAGVYANYKYAAVNLDTGDLFLGGEPPRKKDARIDVSFKAAYRYKTPEALVSLLLEKSGIYSDTQLSFDERNFAKTLIESPVLEHNLPQWSSHGRPQFITEQSGQHVPVARYIQTHDDAPRGRVFYFGGDRHLLQYRRRDEVSGELDEYKVLAQSPVDESIIQFVRHGEDFYVLTVTDWRGRHAKLWKVTNALNTNDTAWTEVSGAYPTASHFYDHIDQVNPVADNRKNFRVLNGFLYYVFLDGNETGIRRFDLSSDPASPTIHTIHSGAAGVTALTTTELSWDFWIEDNTIYTFHCQRLPENTGENNTNFLRVFSFALTTDFSSSSGWNPVRDFERVSGMIHSETLVKAEDWKVRMVSDVAFRNNSLYFVLTYSRNLNRVGFSEIRKLDISSPGRVVLKTYDNALYSARSLVEHGGLIYFVEGTWLSGIRGVPTFTYPTFKDAGHFYSVDVMDQLTDRGPVWRTVRGTDGLGQYTAFCSNLLNDGTNLHVIGGYGLLANSNSDSIQSTDIVDSEVRNTNNFMWLQYGKELSAKIPVFRTNDRTVWELLEELAIVCDFEVGFTSGQDEIVEFKKTYPHLTLDEKGYLFFRKRDLDPAKVSGLSLDEGDLVGVSSELDTLLVFNYVSVPVGDGVWIDEDENRQPDDPVRAFPVPSQLLGSENYAWAELLTSRILERHKEPLLKIRLPVKFLPQVERGHIIQITSEYHSFENLPFRVTQVMHNGNNWQTEIEAREVPGVLDPPVVVPSDAGLVVPTESLGVALVADSTRILLIDNVSKYVRAYSAVYDDKGSFADQSRSVSGDLNLGPGDFFDATLVPRTPGTPGTPEGLVVLDKSAVLNSENRLRLFPSDGTSEILFVDLDADRKTGELAGDWRGVAYNAQDQLLYVMNVLGAIRTYKLSDRMQNESLSLNLDLEADWQGIEFAVDNRVDTLLTLVGNVPTVLAWDLSQHAGSGIARFLQKDVVLSENVAGWTGIAVHGDTLFGCHGGTPGFSAFDR